jgi:nucleotide-binding universal stress UspA family protein
MAHPIVLGYDGSTCASAALDEAIELGRDTQGSRVILVYCHEPPAGLSCALDPACAAAKELRDYERRVATEVEPMLSRAAERVRAAGIQADVQLMWDDPSRALQRVAHTADSHVIVVGSHGGGPIAGALGRHTPWELLHHSDVPVLVVPFREDRRRH